MAKAEAEKKDAGAESAKDSGKAAKSDKSAGSAAGGE